MRPLKSSLVLHLVDDAAVFPPGSAPLPQAVAAHRQHRRSSYASTIGPLLVPVGAARELVELVGDTPLAAALIARPGTAVETIEDGVDTLIAAQHVRVTGIELGWTPAWRTIALGGLPVTLEVPRGDVQLSALDDISRAALRSNDIQAKFRTGATPTWTWPGERELAAFITSAVQRGLAFKLTGGLHHAIRADHAPGDAQHGLLNVLVATHVALEDDTRTDEVEAALAERDPLALVPIVTSWSAAQVATLRATFTAYGCCDVTDPLRELSHLGLLSPDIAADLERP